MDYKSPRNLHYISDKYIHNAIARPLTAIYRRSLKELEVVELTRMSFEQLKEWCLAYNILNTDQFHCRDTLLKHVLKTKRMRERAKFVYKGKYRVHVSRLCARCKATGIMDGEGCTWCKARGFVGGHRCAHLPATEQMIERNTAPPTPVTEKTTTRSVSEECTTTTTTNETETVQESQPTTLQLQAS
jgi:hypothetical protein